jgi:hypothetical protein
MIVKAEEIATEVIAVNEVDLESENAVRANPQVEAEAQVQRIPKKKKTVKKNEEKMTEARMSVK